MGEQQRHITGKMMPLFYLGPVPMGSKPEKTYPAMGVLLLNQGWETVSAQATDGKADPEEIH